MKETLKKLMKDYLEANGYDLSEEKMDDLVDEYESMQTFTELEDGSFEMVTGNTYDEVSDWIRHKAIWWI
ncbi:hypothetical protein [Desulfotomaculum sp. OF05-3]|mgnify:FL=1|jgi:isopropylmalate/homocitrate/citramalate synthase|uniref:hypothetical protein n=1 Tax=Desulfotomaculum sp. OF05-3 TaxID=2305243 RepID=UPI000E3FC904|nr:hypothetical protein [Desulfotomaculum sp. OF05-3]RGE10343.1 hypothetical protein DXA87_17185 [Desulfotomaculum sp. OF05-3]